MSDLRNIEDAKAAFWKVIAAIHPECTSGDLDFAATREFDEACTTVVNAWREANMPKTGALAVLIAMGFEECSTGGGCTALEFTRPDGQQCLVTNDALAPRAGEGWDVGFYESQESKIGGEQIDCTWYAHDALFAALTRIAAWRVG